LHIVPYTRRHARNVLLSYMMKLYSGIIKLQTIVQSVFSPCHSILDEMQHLKRPSNHVVVKSSAVVVFMRCAKKIVREVGRVVLVHSAELQWLPQQQRKFNE
jgi:hypothetical protein